MTTDELNAMLARLAAAQDRTDAQLEALGARIAAAQDQADARKAEADARQAKIDAQLAKTDAQLKALGARIAAAHDQADADTRRAKTDAQLAETDAQFARNAAQQAEPDDKLNRLWDKLDREAQMYGGVGNNQAAEEFYYNSLKADPVLGGVRFDFIDKNVTRSHDGIEDEFDLLLVNGRAVYVVEVKYKAHENDLQRLLDSKAVNFRRLYPEYADREQRFGLASFHVHDELKRAALAKGVTVLQRKGDVIESIAA